MSETTQQVVDIAFNDVLFIIACVAGKHVMYRYETQLAFNGSAIAAYRRKCLVESKDNYRKADGE